MFTFRGCVLNCTENLYSFVLANTLSCLTIAKRTLDTVQPRSNCFFFFFVYVYKLILYVNHVQIALEDDKTISSVLAPPSPLQSVYTINGTVQSTLIVKLSKSRLIHISFSYPFVIFNFINIDAS